MGYKGLPKDVLAVINPPIWDSYYYVSVLTRKAYESTIPALLKKEIITGYSIMAAALDPMNTCLKVIFRNISALM